MKQIGINLPLDEIKIKKLKSGDYVLLSGNIYTARDAAHKELVRLIKSGKKLPIKLKNAIIYYTGPTPAKPGNAVGSIGPTTSKRMDIYTPLLLEHGLKGMIGKGGRAEEVVDSIKRNKAVYFAAVGGAGAYLSKRVKSCKLLAFKDLGPEAIYGIEVENFPVIVINDIYGGDFYKRKK